MEASYGDPATSLYLDLMKSCLTYSLWSDSYNPVIVSSYKNPFKNQLMKRLRRWLARDKIQMVQEQPFNATTRAEGRDHPALSHTMIGRKRLDNLEFCITDALTRQVPGDLIETGVWRGGATIFMRAVLKAHQVTDRKVWVADSFEGLPAPSPDEYPADRGAPFHEMTHLAVSLETVKDNFAKYGLLDDQVAFLKGWFKDTLHVAPIEKLAVLRLDGDMYESTMDALVPLYPKLSVGGYIIIDDYSAIEACKQAVHDYRAQHNITEEIIPVDWSAVYWRRER
jgi:hypothetical protein